MNPDPDFDFDSLTGKQRDCMMWLMMGQDSFEHFNQRTVESLVKRGWIEKVQQRQGIYIVYRYVMPVGIHVRWCDWCAKNCPDDEPEAEIQATRGAGGPTEAAGPPARQPRQDRPAAAKRPA